MYKLFYIMTICLRAQTFEVGNNHFWLKMALLLDVSLENETESIQF